MIKNIIFDFDGVILDSIPVKTEGFRTLFKDFSTNEVEKLIEFHILNGGTSRYVKIKYFFNKVLKKNINNEATLNYANIYSELTREELTKEKYLIEETIYFIQKEYKNYNMHIASGADENDLQYICSKLDLNKYFLSISGSPTIKSTIVKKILDTNSYKKNETILIGDSINDYEAAKSNAIVFYGFNNEQLKERHRYIYSFKNKNIF